MKTLVLGGTGWVGHHIALAFHADGHDVTVATRGKKSTYTDALPADVAQVVADKGDANDMARVLATPYDVVIDSVPTEKSIDQVFAHAKQVGHYIHCSSTGGYAPLPTVPGDETLPYDHFMGGWKQKDIVDTKVLGLHREHGFAATVIRPSYITGPGLLPIDNVGGRREDFIPDVLAGKVLDLPDDGLALLHPVHVRDLGQSFLLAAKQPKSIGEIYNICLDRAVTLNRYIELTAEALNQTANIHHMPTDDILAKYGNAVEERGLRFFATHMCYDITKAKTQLGYRPHCTVEEAIAENARWAAG